MSQVGNPQGTVDVQGDSGSLREARKKVTFELTGDDALYWDGLARRFGLPKAVVARVTLDVSRHPESGSVVDRLQALADERNLRETAAHNLESVGSNTDSQPQLFGNLVKGLVEQLDARAREREKRMAEFVDENGSAVLEDMLETLQQVKERLDSLEIPQAAPAPALEGVQDSLKGLADVVGQQLPTMVAEALESRLAEKLQNIVSQIIDEKFSGLERVAISLAQGRAASGDAGEVVQSLESLRATVQTMAADLQDLRMGLADPEAPAVDLSGLENGVGHIAQMVDALVEESSKPFYLQSSKPIGKAFVGKLRVVKEA